MAGYRQIHTEFWKDEYIIELDPPEKLLFIYLFSNDQASIGGLYKLPARVMANETGLDLATVERALAKFDSDGKVLYRNGVVLVVNMMRYHANRSVTTQKRILADASKIPNCELKRMFLAAFDTPSIPHRYGIDTETSASVKEESESESESEAEAEAEEPGPDPKPAARRYAAALDFSGAQRAIEQVTGWVAIPGNPEDVKAYLGVVMDISTSRNGDTVEYLRPYFAEFRRRYPRSTKMFWLTEWAVQGVIPEEKASPGPRGAGVSVDDLRAQGYNIR